MSIEELILDEEEAIRGYEKALEGETDPDIIRAFNAIIIDEKKHIQMLKKLDDGQMEAMKLYGLK